jgi:hypothetical protein
MAHFPFVMPTLEKQPYLCKTQFAFSDLEKHH